MPSTTLNWVMATIRPRYRAGEISAVYSGDTTDAPPTASPPSQRKNRNDHQSQANAQPTAETKYSTPNQASVPRRPRASAGQPAPSEPMIVPISALATVKPSRLSLSP